MIDHLFIKNYKAFKKESIPLDKNTLLIGTNASGKTTVLEALDLFFNNVFNYEWIRDVNEDVVVEIHLNDERYRKTYSPPGFDINFKKCIGNMYDINHIKYLYIKDSINNAKLLNDILSVNLAKKIDSEDAAKVFKVFDYIDGIVGNSNFELFQIQTKYEMKINKDLTFSKEEYSKLVSGITYPYLILGIDNCETNFESKSLKKFTEFTYQTILTTRSKQVIQGYDYFVHALYKDGVKEEFDTIKSVVSTRNRTYLLVEGKYDVAWFETGIKLLGKQLNYRVIPCGGFGNIEYVKQQLEKEGFHTLVITDGDVMNDTSLKKDIIELYGDIDYINKRFHTEFKKMPNSKRELFRAVSVKDDVVKKVLSSWSRKGLTLESEFVKELHGIITKYESRT